MNKKGASLVFDEKKWPHLFLGNKNLAFFKKVA